MTAGAGYLKGPFLRNVGMDESVPIVIAGMEEMKEFPTVINREERLVTDTKILEEEVVTVATRLAKENPDIGAMVLERSDMPPFAAAIHEAINLPIFDFITFINMVYLAAVKKRYEGFM